MRLINTETLALDEFFDRTIPQYVILSHTWGENEISFQQFQNGVLNNKIKQCCVQARKEGFGYAWVDTCCIDKTSSAELSEAINSMFRWYKEATLCYVYLEDFSLLRPDVKWWDSDTLAAEQLGNRLKPCKWFTRGWTLQELIAPPVVEFYDTHWVRFGTRMSLQMVISALTRIPVPMLTASKALQDYNVAVRMSWASRRNTTRLEDRAYCLMGLFDVNMPMLYGEGRRAFQRLQEEILKRNEDYSLFAWSASEEYFSLRTFRSIFAESPSDFDEDSTHYRFSRFRTSGFRFTDLVNLRAEDFGLAKFPTAHPAPSMTPRGLSITLPILERGTIFLDGGIDQVFFALICSVRSKPGTFLCIRLSPIDSDSHTYIRRDLLFDDALVPHTKGKLFGELEPITSEDIPSFRFTEINVASWNIPQHNFHGTFSWRIEAPSNVMDKMRRFSVQLMKVLSQNLVEDFDPHLTGAAEPFYCPCCTLIFRYSNNDSTTRSGGIVFSMLYGVPCCNILRTLTTIEFLQLAQPQTQSKLADLLYECKGKTDNPRRKQDLCRMRIGSVSDDAWLVARVRKTSSTTPREDCLVLELAVDTPSDDGNSDSDSTVAEIGVVDLDYREWLPFSASVTSFSSPPPLVLYRTREEKKGRKGKKS